jgi:hypothetical protein
MLHELDELAMVRLPLTRELQQAFDDATSRLHPGLTRAQRIRIAMCEYADLPLRMAGPTVSSTPPSQAV